MVFARLGPIELFGEQGILDGEPRDASARAMGKARVKVVPKTEFMVWLQNDPKAGLRVMGLLVDRLRAADAIIMWQRESDQIGPSARPIGVLDLLQVLGPPLAHSRAARRRSLGRPVEATVPDRRGDGQQRH